MAPLVRRHRSHLAPLRKLGRAECLKVHQLAKPCHGRGQPLQIDGHLPDAPLPLGLVHSLYKDLVFAKELRSEGIGQVGGLSLSNRTKTATANAGQPGKSDQHLTNRVYVHGYRRWRQLRGHAALPWTAVAGSWQLCSLLH